MTINQDMVQGKWREIKGELQKAWGKLTDDELDKTKGDIKAITGIIQQRYGEAHAKPGEKLAQIFQKFSDKKDAVVEGFKENLKK